MNILTWPLVSWLYVHETLLAQQFIATRQEKHTGWIIKFNKNKTPRNPQKCIFVLWSLIWIFFTDIGLWFSCQSKWQLTDERDNLLLWHAQQIYLPQRRSVMDCIPCLVFSQLECFFWVSCSEQVAGYSLNNILNSSFFLIKPYRIPPEHMEYTARCMEPLCDTLCWSPYTTIIWTGTSGIFCYFF